MHDFDTEDVHAGTIPRRCLLRNVRACEEFGNCGRHPGNLVDRLESRHDVAKHYRQGLNHFTLD